VLDDLTVVANGDAERRLAELRTMFNAHLGIIREAVDALERLPIIAAPVGKAADAA
jgi:hypothetical protein